MPSLPTLNGQALYWSILSGGKKIIEHQEEINKINVFPVPDGDTGSNLAATATSIIYHAKEDNDLSQVAYSIGEAALDGARGNSGVILAQFLYGIGEEVSDVVELNIQKFAQAVKKASEYVYQAIPTPQEGTIITVMREWAEYIHAEHHNFNDFTQLFEKAEHVAQEALQRTTEQLEALNIAKVVDAGAKGFVLFIEGIKETIQKRAFTRDDHDIDHMLINDTDALMAEAESLTEESLHNRFCTETCLIGDNISRDAVLQILEEDSDSIVIAGSEKKLRLHFHTNHPVDMFAKLLDHGTFTFQKVEDMRQQYNITHHRKNAIALVIDSGITLSPEYLEQEQINVVPLGMTVNGIAYQDGKTLSTEIFDKYYADPKCKSNSSQASPKSYADMFNYLSKYYDSIISLSMGINMSSTFNSAKQGRDLFLSKNPDYKIDVINSDNLSGGGGAIAMSVQNDINAGLSHDEIVSKIPQHIQNTATHVNFKTIDHLLRSGRLGAFKGGIIKLFKLTPLLEVTNGVVSIVDKAIGQPKAIKKLIKKICSVNKEVAHYTISHNNIDSSLLSYTIKTLHRKFGFEASDVSLCTPSIATNVGSEAICIAIVYK